MMTENMMHSATTIPFQKNKYGYGKYVRFEVIKWSILAVMISRMLYLIIAFMKDDKFVKYY